MDGELVRDRWAESREGSSGELTRLSEPAFETALLHQLGREALALNGRPDIARRAQIAELLNAYDELHGFCSIQVEQARQEQLDQMGGYRRRLYREERS